jgi:4-hydroxyphenylpyruvate dioxygenase
MAPSAVTPPTQPTVISGDGAQYDLNGHQQTESGGGYRGYDHITWYVGNAKQAAAYYSTRMGFYPVARRGLETGSRLVASHVISNGAATFVLTSPLRSIENVEETASQSERDLVKEIHEHLRQHGDAVKDVAFEVDNVDSVYNHAVAKGAVSVQSPKVTTDDDGEVKTATIQTYGDTTHTLIERSRYRGAFLPGFRKVDRTADPILVCLPSVSIEAIDHCVGNQDWDEMDKACE